MNPSPDWNILLTPPAQVLPLNPGEPVFVYGVGTVGNDVISLLRHLGHLVAGVLDAKSLRTELSGLPAGRGRIRYRAARGDRGVHRL
jgi:hypothetical protein